MTDAKLEVVTPTLGSFLEHVLELMLKADEAVEIAARDVSVAELEAHLRLLSRKRDPSRFDTFLIGAIRLNLVFRDVHDRTIEAEARGAVYCPMHRCDTDDCEKHPDHEDSGPQERE